MPYRCDKCDYQKFLSGPSFQFYGVPRYYRLPNGKEFYIKGQLGWCFSCSDIRMIEDLSVEPVLKEIADNREKKDRKAEEIQKLKSEFELLKERWVVKIRRLFSIPEIPAQKSAELKRLENDLNYFDRHQIELNEQIVFFQSRKTPIKCLGCGSENVKALSETTHPGCGGRLFFTEEGEKKQIRWNVSPTAEIYNEQGIFVTVEDRPRL
jgi:hypothetical protein